MKRPRVHLLVVVEGRTYPACASYLSVATYRRTRLSLRPRLVTCTGCSALLASVRAQQEAKS
jgi:hypothetical protein